MSIFFLKKNSTEEQKSTIRKFNVNTEFIRCNRYFSQYVIEDELFKEFHDTAFTMIYKSNFKFPNRRANYRNHFSLYRSKNEIMIQRAETTLELYENDVKIICTLIKPLDDRVLGSYCSNRWRFSHDRVQIEDIKDYKKLNLTNFYLIFSGEWWYRDRGLILCGPLAYSSNKYNVEYLFVYMETYKTQFVSTKNLTNEETYSIIPSRYWFDCRDYELNSKPYPNIDYFLPKDVFIEPPNLNINKYTKSPIFSTSSPFMSQTLPNLLQSNVFQSPVIQQNVYPYTVPGPATMSAFGSTTQQQLPIQSVLSSDNPSKRTLPTFRSTDIDDRNIADDELSSASKRIKFDERRDKILQDIQRSRKEQNNLANRRLDDNNDDKLISSRTAGSLRRRYSF